MEYLVRGFFLYAMGAVVAIYALGLAVPRRRSPGGRWLVLYLLVHVVWMGVNSLVYTTIPITAKVALLMIASVSAIAPVALFLFAVEYANPSYRLGNGALIPLAIAPAVAIGAALTNRLHNQYITEASVNLQTGLHVVEYGPVYFGMVYLGIALVLLTIGILAMTAVRSSGAIRMQAGLVITGIAVMGGSYLYISSQPVRPLGVDPAMSGIVIGLAVAVALQSTGLLQLSPVGRAEVFDMLPEGFIIADKSGTVVDANPAVYRLIGHPRNRALFGTPVTEVFHQWTCLGQPCVPDQFSQTPITLDPIQDAVPLGVQRWLLRDSTGQEIGHAYIIRDNSAEYWTRTQLEEVQGSLASWSEDMRELERLLKRFG